MIKFRTLLLVLALGFPVAAFAGIGDIKFDDKIESMKKAGVGPVIFSHDNHEKRNKCNDCHPKVFKDKKGANDISMKQNMNQRFCGYCHNSGPKPFELYNCAKCHTNVGAAK